MKRQLVDTLRASTFAEGERMAAFVVDEGTVFAANPFPLMTAGAARQRRGLGEIASAGLPCLMASLGSQPAGEALRQEILKSPMHLPYLLRHGESGLIVGAGLHGKLREALPLFVRPEPVVKPDPPATRAPAKRSARKPSVLGHLELFETSTGCDDPMPGV